MNIRVVIIMDYKQLQIFLKVVESHSLTAVAKEMSITQPAVSGILKKLETELGVILFYRVGKMLIPNENGKFLYGMAQSIKFSSDLVKYGMKNAERKKSNIVITLTVFSDLFFELTGKFSKEFPDISFTFRPGTRMTQDHRLSTSDFFLLSQQELQGETYMSLDTQEQLYVILPIFHPLAKREKISLYELKDEYFIFSKNTIEAGYERCYMECLEAGFTPKVSMTVDTAVIKYAAIAAGIGVGLVYSNETALANQVLNCVRVPLNGNFRIRPIVLAWYSDRLNSASICLLDFIKKYTRRVL